MRHLRRILRLHHQGSSAREIVRAAGVARSTVQDGLKRAAAAKLSWPLPDGLTDEELELQLFAKSGNSNGSGVRKRPEPDWAELVRELRRPAVTMVILWEEYRKIWPDGYPQADTIGQLELKSDARFGTTLSRAVYNHRRHKSRPPLPERGSAPLIDQAAGNVMPPRHVAYPRA